MKKEKFSLSDYNKNANFKHLEAPKGYFDDLEDRVHQKINIPSKRTLPFLLTSITGITSLLIFAFVFFNQNDIVETQAETSDWLSYLDEDIEEIDYNTLMEDLTDEELNRVYNELLSSN